ncbi:MAG: hypothetical protein SWK90_10135 [Chloroflexota bacterium]|nr:hypothetical protein [Chloroflexota bacterium]
MRLRIGVLSLILVAVLAAPIRAQQPDLHRAGLVVVHGDGNVVSACVAFTEESLSGAELLRRSGLGVALDAYGGLGYGVCAIGSEGCFAGQDCFCQCRGAPCAYWIYSHRRPDGSWAVSGVGASGWQVHDGDVDGWVWGDGSTAPPIVAFEQVCLPDSAQPAAPTAAIQPATPVPATQSPSPTVTPAPLPTPILPTDTAAPLAGQQTNQPTNQPTMQPTTPPTTLPTNPPTTLPTSPPIPLPTTTPAHPVEAHEQDDNPFNYVVFGIMALGLAGWLILAGNRRRHV